MTKRRSRKHSPTFKGQVAMAGLKSERAAALYSQIGSTKFNGLALKACLRFVIDRIAEHSVNRITDLLRWAVASQIVSPSAALP